MPHGVTAEWHGHTITLRVEGEIVVTFHTGGPGRAGKLMDAFQATSDTKALQDAYRDGCEAVYEAIEHGQIEYSRVHDQWVGDLPEASKYQP